MLIPYRPETARREALACRLLALLLILSASGLRLLYLAWDCPLELAPDEAHYWDWSRHLDWSYYSKGPLVAWIIRASCELFGPLSAELTGHETLAVRFPAVLLGASLLAGLYVLTVQVHGRERLALAVVALALTLPPLAAGSVLMTIDSPYAALWCWALVAGHRAVFRRSAWAWSVLGVLVGLGILAKYNMALFLPSLGLFLLTTREYRGDLLRPGFWIACVIAGLLGGVPILLWNYQHDWVSFRHVNSLASGMKTQASFHPLGPLVYLGGQFALLLGFWFVAWVSAMIASRPGRENDPGVRYLWWLSLPMFAVFLAFSFKTGGGELNWPATAYLSGLILAVAWWQRQLHSPVQWYRHCSAGSLAAACVLGLSLQLLAHRPDWFRPALLAVAGEPTAARPFPLRRVDPTVRLRGWRFLAAEVDRERARLQEQGIDPVLAGAHWTLPGELGFYCAGQPQWYSVGRTQGDRHSQYDLWRPNPLNDPEAFRGRSFLIVGGVGPEILAAFGRVEPVREVIYRESGQPVASWIILIAHDFRGFPQKKREAGY